jgi:TolB-like protein/cytochrome c-type biogenesis protein CcmH/NrfG
MGEVYRATDTKLGRDVAVKLLPAEMAHDPERLARFQREARAVAALNHPHIVTIFSVEEADGVHFLTMELVEGESLDRCIPVGGLPVERIVEIATALAEALGAAHEKGIVHRDLKPANVMVTNDGRLKVLDFGLAKDIHASSPANATLTSAGHTQAGVVMGTPAYMSPEQIAGRALDHRTDIFSLGVVLYEMASGRRPFEGASSAELASSILRDTPSSVADLRADLPRDLAQVIQGCLEKSATDRFPSARDVQQRLRGLATGAAPIGRTDTASRPAAAAPDSGSARAEEGFWVAVLPFKYNGNNVDLTALAEGLTEEIVTGMSRFSYLRVISLSSTSRYAHGPVDVRAAGKELGAHYVMEGSLRQAGSRLRIAVQLVNAASGAHLWAETYDRAFSPEAIFELQDEVVPRIVSTVADTHGVLPHTMGEALRNKDPEQLSPYEALLRGLAHFLNVNAKEHALARTGLERAVQQAPSHADCWAMLSMLYKEEYAHGINLRPDPIGRAFAAARRAVESAPSNHLAYHALAASLFFRREIPAFRTAAQRAVALNSMDGFTFAYMGMLTAFAGDWEHGCALAERSRGLNPHHPGWYWFPPLFNDYRQKDYRGALEIALKVQMPGFWRTNLALAVSYGQLGEQDAAGKAVRELLAIRPDFAATAREELGKWWEPELVEHLLDGLRKAGLEIADEKKPATAGPTKADGRAVSGFSNPPAIAVLPFQNLSGDPDQDYFADGITEEIINALAHIPGLRVAGRSSAFSFKGRNEDLRSVGTKLGVASILEGTLRRSGDRLRITAQLIDAGNGYQLWSERYDRVMEDVFAVQDEIATTIAGRLKLSLAADRDSQPLQPPTRNMAAYNLYLKGRGLLYQRGLSIIEAIDCFTEAVALDPAYAQAWAGLADGYTTSGYSGYKPAAEVMPRALEAARRALQLDPDLAEAHSALACTALLYELDFDLAEREFHRALELNPSYPQARAWYGLFFLQWVAGREREGRDEVLRLLQLDPLSAYANAILSFSDVCCGRVPEAVDHARRGVDLDPNSYLAYWSLMQALLCNAQYEEAVAAAEQALAISGRHSWALATLVSIYAAWGKPEEARNIYREVEARSAREYVQPSMVAPAAAAIGDMDQAIAMAQRALTDKDPLFVMLARTWPAFGQLRSDPRFVEIVRQLGLPNWSPAR